jgi:hypothetical protein
MSKPVLGDILRMVAHAGMFNGSPDESPGGGSGGKRAGNAGWVARLGVGIRLEQGPAEQIDNVVLDIDFDDCRETQGE